MTQRMFRTKDCVHEQSVLVSNFVPTLLKDSVRFSLGNRPGYRHVFASNRTGSARDHRPEGWAAFLSHYILRQNWA